MYGRRAPQFLAVLFGFLAALAAPAESLDTIPLYGPVPIGNMIREAYPAVGISSAAAVNEQGDTVGRAVIDNQCHAFVYTEMHGVQLLPSLQGWTSHVAVDIADRDPVTGHVLIAGSAQTLYGDPDRTVVWKYDTGSGVVLETVGIAVPEGADWSTATAVNNQGLVIGYARALGWMTPYQPFVYDYFVNELYLLEVPFNPVDINSATVITGGTYRAQLTEVEGAIVASSIEDLRTAERPSVTRTTALNDSDQVIGVTSMGYSDGAGRIVAGASATSIPTGPGRSCGRTAPTTRLTGSTSPGTSSAASA
jgi:hypothetical protein